MLIGMLMTLGIICLLVAGPSFENTLVAIAVYGGVIGAMIVAFWYSQKMSGGIADFFMGGSGSEKVDKTLGLAERYESEKNYEAAILLYLSAIEKNKKNPAPRRKLVELYFKLGDIGKCIHHMKGIIDLPKGVPDDERRTIMNRIADLYLHQKNDRQSAIAILKRLAKEFPDTKYAKYARERISEIKKG